MRNVAGKNGETPFYPGQPDPMAQQFLQFANEMFGADTANVVQSTENLSLAFLLNLYRQSGDSSLRKLKVRPDVRDKLSKIYQLNHKVATPLFLATRYLIADMYSRVSIEEPALELGMGFGDTSNAILGNRKLAVGSTPVVDEIMGARHHFGNHRTYLAVDAAQIPYADDTFNFIVMNYTFYHLEDPARTCREMLRVLAPGGRIYFNFAIRNRIESTRVLLKLVDALGLHDYGRMASSFVFTDYGGADDTPTKEGCLALLEKNGFVDIESVDHLSPDLSRLIWLTRDLEVLFQLNLHRATGAPSLELAYRQFVENQLAALLSHDSALCDGGDGGTFMFVSARKPGDRTSSRILGDDDIKDRMVCPVTQKLLRHYPGYLWSEEAKIAYPIHQDIALLMPLYGDLWRRQNAQSGSSDPAHWAPFSY